MLALFANGFARVYFFDQINNLIEVAYINDGPDSCAATNLTGQTGAEGTGPGRFVTSFAAGGTKSRVYYVDSYFDVTEIAWSDDNHWHSTNLTGAANAPKATASSQIVYFGLNGWASRVYYVDTGFDLTEIAWGDDDKWHVTNLTAATGAPRPHVPSSIACFADATQATRVHYFDDDMDLIEVGWGGNQEWYWGNLTTQGNAPKSIGPLATFSIGGQGTRIYYLAGATPSFGRLLSSTENGSRTLSRSSMRNRPCLLNPLSRESRGRPSH